MLRKFCLLVIILILVSGSACAADLRLEMQFIIHQKDSESAVTAETLIREHEIMLISGLFPSYAFSIDSEQASLPELTDTTFDLFTLPEATEIIPAFLQILNAETYEGVFAGDLFDNANLAAKGCISAADLLSLFAGHIRTETEQTQDTHSGGILNDFSVLSDMSDFSGLMIQYSMYDNGKYLSFSGTEGDRTLFTASFDCSAPDTVKTVTGYASGGKNYYLDSAVTLVSSNELFFTSSLFADILKQGYRNTVKGTPVVTENWTVLLSEDRKELDFSGTILPENNKKPVEIEGTFSMNNHPALKMKAGFRDWEESYFTLTISMDESPVNTEGLKIISLNNQSDVSETQSAITEITANGLPIMLKMIMALPEEYQDYFMSLMN